MAAPIALSSTLLSSSLRGQVTECVALCFQCQKCASGCPVAYAMDFTPPQLLRMILQRHFIDPMWLLTEVV